MDRFLFFQNAANDCMVYPLKDLVSVEGGDDVLNFVFTNVSAAGVDTVVVVLKDNSSELTAMKEVAQAINAKPHGDGVVVIGDDVNEVYAFSDYVAGASIPASS